MLTLNDKDNLYEISVQSPPPSKDYINLCVTLNEVRLFLSIFFFIGKYPLFK